jgi:hypothetical protein
MNAGKVVSMFASVVGFGTQHNVYNVPALKLLESVEYHTAGMVIIDPPTLAGVGAQPIDWTTHHEQEAEFMPTADQVSRSLRPGGACISIGEPPLVSAWDAAAATAGLRFAGSMAVLWDDTEESAESVYRKTLSERRLAKFTKSSESASLFTTIHWHVKAGLRYRHENPQSKVTWDSNVLVVHRVPPGERQCQTQRPVELFNRFISTMLWPGDLVVDPYCGSGSALVSAAMCEMEWRGGDTDPAMCQVARKRLGRVATAEEWNLRPIRVYKAGKIVDELTEE